MHSFRNSLMTRIFGAIAATTVLVVAVMALLVAVSMRDGFARYLLKGELARFDDLEKALVLAHDAAAPEWPEFARHPRAWNEFLRANTARPTPGRPPPPGPPPPSAGRPPPPGPPPTADRPRPMGPPGGPHGGRVPLGQRLALLAPDGGGIVGPDRPAQLSERRAICSDDGCETGLLGYLELSSPLSVTDTGDRFFLRGQYFALALSALIALLISAVAAYLVARRILVPIRHLEAGAKTMASGDYATRITHSRTDELGKLIGHYNVLAATLERTDKAEREWISNTSHELQTPLAVLRAQIEALQDGVRRPDAETLAAMHGATMRLSRLVQDIKILSYDREGRLGLVRQGEDLCDIVRDAAATARPRFEKMGVTLDLDLPQEALIKCDRARIGQVVDNLLQNAQRYTGAPGRVRLQVADNNGFVGLTIDDTPPAPPEADMPRLFDRFYRAESSRSRVHGGSGLGLAVCRAIVEAHGGAIDAGPSDLGGLRVAVRLPKGTT